MAFEILAATSPIYSVILAVKANTGLRKPTGHTPVFGDGDAQGLKSDPQGLQNDPQGSKNEPQCPPKADIKGRGGAPCSACYNILITLKIRITTVHTLTVGNASR